MILVPHLLRNLRFTETMLSFNSQVPRLLSVLSGLVILAFLPGCGTEIDLYGDTRIEPLSTDRAAANLRSQPVPPGIFKIIPPAAINPKNVADTDPHLLTIDFQSGFNGLPAQVIYRDELIFNERLVSNARGYAGTVSFVYREEPISFTIRFPTMGEETFTVDPDNGRFFALAIKGRQLVVTFQEGPFFYKR